MIRAFMQGITACFRSNIGGDTAVGILVLLIGLSAGCAHPERGGFASATDYGYSIETPESKAAVIRRFEDALTLLQHYGLETHWVHNRNERHEFTFSGKGLNGTVALTLPENRLACISFVYDFAPEHSAGKREGTQLLAQLQHVLSPVKMAEQTSR